MNSEGREVTGTYFDQQGMFRTVDCRRCPGVQPRHYVKEGSKSENVLMCLSCGNVERVPGGRTSINTAVRAWNSQNMPTRESRCGNCTNWGPPVYGPERFCRWNNCTCHGGDGYGCRGFSPRVKQL
jgi:hypothetical protein